MKKIIIFIQIIFTARIRNMGKVMFLLCLSVHRGAGSGIMSGARSGVRSSGGVVVVVGGPLVPGPGAGRGAGVGVWGQGWGMGLP